MAEVKRSPNRTANCDLAMAHSRGGIIHSFSERFKTRKRSFVAASSLGKCPLARRWTSYPLSRTGWLRPRHALASRDEGIELVSMKEGSGLRHRWCAVVWVKENLPLQQHTGHPKQPVGDTA